MDNGHGNQLGKSGFGLATAHKKIKTHRMNGHLQNAMNELHTGKFT